MYALKYQIIEQDFLMTIVSMFFLPYERMKSALLWSEVLTQQEYRVPSNL